MTHDFTRTSGNTLADRRFEMAQTLAKEGDIDAAVDLLWQAWQIAPGWPVIPFTLGDLYAQSGGGAQALDYYRRALALDPEDRLGAQLKIASLSEDTATGMPAAFVEKLFDQYAPRFENHLTQALAYTVPGQIAALVKAQHHMPARILDLGCGTGLGAEPFAEALWIEGVDLSGLMLEEAAAKGFYKALHKAEIGTWLRESELAPFDLVLAADVFTYCGVLEEIFAGVAKHTEPGSLFAFSVQKGDKDFRLEESQRFSHSAEYVTRCLTTSDFKLIVCEERVLRKDRDQDVNGYIVLAKKRS